MPHVVRFIAPRTVGLAEEPAAPLVPGSVRVRTSYSGISAGTELTAYRGTNPYLTQRWDQDVRLFIPGAATASYPIDGWGYSEVGRVVEVAPDVKAPQVGDIVWGIWGHREEAVVAADRLRGHVLPAGVPIVHGVFARVGAIAMNAVIGSEARLGELVAVFGQGVIGLLATRLAVLSGVAVFAVDSVESRRAAATEFGAAHTAAPGDGIAQRLRDLTEGRGADAAIELSGAYPALHEAVRAVGAGGRVVAAGFYQGEGAGLRLGEEFHHNRVQIVASQIGGVPAHLFPRWSVERLQTTFMELVSTGRLDPSPLLTTTVPAADVAAAYRLLDGPPGTELQVVIDFGTETAVSA